MQMSRRIEIVPIPSDFRIVVKKIVSVSDDLNYEYKRHPRLYAIINGYLNLARRRVKDLKFEMEMLISKLRRIIRRRHDGRITKDDYVAEYMKKKSYRRKQKELDDAIFDEESLSGILKALDHKKDMLVGLGANMRHESTSEIRLLKESVRSQIRKEINKAMRKRKGGNDGRDD